MTVPRLRACVALASLALAMIGIAASPASAATTKMKSYECKSVAHGHGTHCVIIHNRSGYHCVRGHVSGRMAYLCTLPAPKPTAPVDDQIVTLSSQAGTATQGIVAPFTVSQKHISINYTYDCSNEGTYSDGSPMTDNFIIKVYDSSDNYVGLPVNVIGHADSQSTTFVLPKGGSYYLAVDTGCKWQVTVTGMP